MSNLTAGFAAVEITPPLGLPMAGYGGRENPALSIFPVISIAAVI